MKNNEKIVLAYLIFLIDYIYSLNIGILFSPNMSTINFVKRSFNYKIKIELYECKFFQEHFFIKKTCT